MTAPDPGIEAAAAALYTEMRSRSLAQARPDMLHIVRRTLPEDFEDLDEPRQRHHRSLARAAVDAWRLHGDLNEPAS